MESGDVSEEVKGSLAEVFEDKYVGSKPVDVDGNVPLQESAHGQL